MSTLNPYLRFNDGRCREAMDFYKSCFGGELSLMATKDTPMAAQMDGKGDLIMHAELKNGSFTLQGADMMRDKAVAGDIVSLSFSADSEAQLRDAFAKLSAGGEVFMPVEAPFWGGLFGVVTDKYGFEWMMSFSGK